MPFEYLLSFYVLLLKARDAASPDVGGHRAGPADADLRGPDRGPHHGRRPPAAVRAVRPHRGGIAARRATGTWRRGRAAQYIQITIGRLCKNVWQE